MLETQNNLAFDEKGDMDVGFGEEYRKRQNTDTYFTPTTIRSDARLNKLADVILNDAIENRAKDVHINQWSGYGVVEFRVGREIIPVRKIHKYAVDGLITVLRNRAEVSLENIHELEISGRMTHRFGPNDYDIRASFVPAINGQSAVLRILYANTLTGSLDKLGLPDDVALEMKRVLNLKEGMIILSGGTGSGKTTTLYTAIHTIMELYRRTKKVFAIENPVEYRVDGVTQISTDDLRGVTFGSALKSVLRSDPDVILLGEVNDEGTAAAAVRAATTGHLMLTTLHANNTLEVRNALKQLGASPLDLGTALKLVLYQTLQDKLCEHCREEYVLTAKDKGWIDSKLRTTKQLVVVYKKNPDGCKYCNHQGIKGQVLLVEMLGANRTYNKGADETQGDIYKLQDYLLETEGSKYYPLEWDVFQHLEKGNIDMDTAYHLID